MATTPTIPQVDAAVPRFNQAWVAVLTAVAFLADLPWLVAVTFAILAISRFAPRWAPFTRLYTGVVRPKFLADRAVVLEDARPPRFAQLLGTIFLGGASIAFLVGATWLGWAITLMVTALAALASVTAICVGCILYEKTVLRDTTASAT